MQQEPDRKRRRALDLPRAIDWPPHVVGPDEGELTLEQVTFKNFEFAEGIVYDEPEDRNRRRVLELEEALSKLVDTALWMSGSPSFSPEGEARVGWLRKRQDLYNAIRVLLDA